MATEFADIFIEHASETIATTVKEWFHGKISEYVCDGTRSIRTTHPDKEAFWLKIKGAGYAGGSIQFGTLWNSRLRAPVFDFDGRMMEDIASGHDNAYRGGASFQQVAVEYRMSKMLQSLGFEVVPCIGYGCIRKDGLTSWFSLFEVGRTWETVVVPKFSIEEYLAAKISMGLLLTQLAVNHKLVGHCWYMAKPDGRYVLKDLHPFRSVDSISMSQLSWVMQVYFVLHIVALAALHFSREAGPGRVPEDVQAYPFRGFLPDASKAEHEALRWSLVSPYMLTPPQSFDQAALLHVLRSNRITATLMEMCPEEYARPI